MPIHEITPPKFLHLHATALPHWRAVIASRNGAWTAHDLVHAAALARCLAAVERITAELASEPESIANRRGSRMLNPKVHVVEMLSRRAMALTRLLNLHGRASGAREDRAKLRKAEADARDVLQGLDQGGRLEA